MAEDRGMERLKDVVCAYGCDPVRWPEAERAELMEMAGVCGDVPWMKEAEELDELLNCVPGAAMGAGLSQNILAAARTTPRAMPDKVIEMPLPNPRRSLLRRMVAQSGPATFLAASLFAGLWLGASNQIEFFANGEPLGLVELAPGVSEEASLSALWWDALASDTGWP